MKTKKIILSLLCLNVISLCSCSNDNKKTSFTPDTDPLYYSKVEERAKFSLDTSNNIEEDFENGLDDDEFYVIDGAWHTNVSGWKHNGVQSRNVFYAKDKNNKKYLAIKAKGYYNKDDENHLNEPEGGCILSKNHLGPGRYEIKMAAMPREGGVTAMWTYCTTTGNEATSQNEIDIELGGASSSGSQFEEYWTTSWTSKSNKQTDKVDVSTFDGLNYFLNDGKMHTYTFDWYTEYHDQEYPRVDWFIDGVFTKSISGSMVPDTMMPLWIGVWFPPAWAGNPSFKEDYLLIENISYKAFDVSSQYVNSCRAEASYTKHKPSSLNMETLNFEEISSINKLSNGDFESLDICKSDSSYYGWSVDPISKGNVTLSQGNNSPSSFKLTASNDQNEYNGEYLTQSITNAYQGFKYKFSIDAKLDDNSNGNIELYFKNKTGKLISKEIIKVDSKEFKTYTKDIIMPQDSFILEIDLTSESGSTYYDNASLIFQK